MKTLPVAIAIMLIAYWLPHTPDHLGTRELPEVWWSFYNFYVGKIYIYTGVGLSWLHIS